MDKLHADVLEQICLFLDLFSIYKFAQVCSLTAQAVRNLSHRQRVKICRQVGRYPHAHRRHSIYADRFEVLWAKFWTALLIKQPELSTSALQLTTIDQICQKIDSSINDLKPFFPTLFFDFGYSKLLRRAHVGDFIELRLSTKTPRLLCVFVCLNEGVYSITSTLVSTEELGGLPSSLRGIQHFPLNYFNTQVYSIYVPLHKYRQQARYASSIVMSDQTAVTLGYFSAYSQEYRFIVVHTRRLTQEEWFEQLYDRYTQPTLTSYFLAILSYPENIICVNYAHPKIYANARYIAESLQNQQDKTLQKIKQCSSEMPWKSF